jgi:hypothetical protein
MKKALAYTMFLGVVFLQPAAANELKFKGGIGVIPVSSGVAVSPTPATAQIVESVNRNIVRGVQPAGQIWRIDKLNATVSADGRIHVDGKGLVLGGGNNAGRAPSGTGALSVFATLICEPVAPFTERISAPAGSNTGPTHSDVEAVSVVEMRRPHRQASLDKRSPRNSLQNASASSGLAKQNTTKSRSSRCIKNVRGATEKASANAYTTS